MQALLTNLLEIIAIGFALIMLADFVTGLIAISATTNYQSDESENHIQSTEVKQVKQQIATIKWLNMITSDETIELDEPNVIDLASRRLQKCKKQQTKSTEQLRQLCSVHGIKWRNVIRDEGTGKLRHLKKAEMQSALEILSA